MTRPLPLHVLALSTLLSVSPDVGAALLANDVARQDQPADSRASCIDIEVNGERVPDYACLSHALSSTSTGGQDRPARPLTGSEEIARRPPTRLGLATPEATRQRMGNTFGKSTLPQRPQQPPPALPPAIRKP